MKEMLNTKANREPLVNDKDFSSQNDNEYIVKKAYLRKLKSMKKKYFVLRRESGCEPSRLDYYGSEKKFKNNALNAKRSIILKDCFSINRKCTSKSRYCIALYTSEDCVTLIFDNENDMNDWLQTLLELQNGVEGIRRPQYDHVWQVTIGKKGLGENRNMTGIYRLCLCLTEKSLLLFKVAPESENRNYFEFPLISIRRCGHTENYFFMDLGRSSCIGPGELWIMTEDTITSHDMHETILKAMKSSKSHEDFGPLPRPRSASTSENTKTIIARRPTSGGILSPTSTVQPTSMISSISYASITTASGIRDRCDSLPSRSRTTSEGTSRVIHGDNAQPRIKSHDMRQYVGLYSRTMSYSPPSNNILSPSSNACSTDSAGSSLSVDDYDSMTINGISSYQDFYIPSSQISRDTSAIPTEPPIREEEAMPDDYLSMDPSAQNVSNDYSMINISKPVTTTQSQQQLRSSLNLSLHCKNNASSSPVSSPGVNSYVVQNHDEGYIPMSPVGSTESTGYKSCSTRSSSIFERSSISSDMSNGYVPMAPRASSTVDSTASAIDNDGYLDMSQLSTSLPKQESHLGTSPRLMSMSGVPPGKQRTEEFRLEKVKSYFAPEDDDSFDFIKPVRSYSMGSRPQMHTRSHTTTKMAHNHSRSSRSTLASHTIGAFGSSTPKEEESMRVRAYSMGSQTTGGREAIKEQRKNSIK